MLDFVAMREIEHLFLQDCPLLDSDNENFVYHIGNTDYKFNCCNVDLIQFATEDGFVVDLDKKIVNEDDLITFIRYNRTFTLGVNEEDEVVIK